MPPQMKQLLLLLAVVIACLSSGCVVDETVTEHGEVVSEGYKVKEPFHKHEDAAR
jgi:hypothetical protein